MQHEIDILKKEIINLLNIAERDVEVAIDPQDHAYHEGESDAYTTCINIIQQIKPRKAAPQPDAPEQHLPENIIINDKFTTTSA